jgi:D-serine deaminase-like pyridoxal phosphate-dependent protein
MAAIAALAPELLTRALEPVLDDLITPALVIDLDAVEHNLGATLERVGGARRWRPHLKTCKQAVIVEAMIAAGLRHFKVATLDELALTLAAATAAGCAAGEIDILLAYPPRRAQLAALRRLLEGDAGPRVSVLADSPAHLDELARWTEQLNFEAALRLLPDVDLGMARTGSPPAIWRELDALPATVEFVGLHGYDGHLRWEQRELAHAGYDRLVELASALGEALELAPEDLELLTSGTHSYAHALTHPRLRAGPWQHRVSPGTLVLSDLRSAEAAADIGLRQAAFIASRVISTGEGRLTLDAGSKAVTPDAGWPRPSCTVLAHPELQPRRASEEHLPCEFEAGGDSPELGALLWLVPDHVCTTVNLHREALWIRGGRYAGRGPVGAAGHRPFFDAAP